MSADDAGLASKTAPDGLLREGSIELAPSLYISLLWQPQRSSVKRARGAILSFLKAASECENLVVLVYLSSWIDEDDDAPATRQPNYSFQPAALAPVEEFMIEGWLFRLDKLEF